MSNLDKASHSETDKEMAGGVNILLSNKNEWETASTNYQVNEHGSISIQPKNGAKIQTAGLNLANGRINETLFKVRIEN